MSTFESKTQVHFFLECQSQTDMAETDVPCNLSVDMRLLKQAARGSHADFASVAPELEYSDTFSFALPAQGIQQRLLLSY